MGGKWAIVAHSVVSWAGLGIPSRAPLSKSKSMAIHHAASAASDTRCGVVYNAAVVLTMVAQRAEFRNFTGSAFGVEKKAGVWAPRSGPTYIKRVSSCKC